MVKKFLILYKNNLGIQNLWAKKLEMKVVWMMKAQLT